MQHPVLEQIAVTGVAGGSNHNPPATNVLHECAAPHHQQLSHHQDSFIKQMFPTTFRANLGYLRAVKTVFDSDGPLAQQLGN